MSEDRQVKTEQLAKSRIIIVDDEPIMLDMIETLLRDWRHEVTVLRFQSASLPASPSPRSPPRSPRPTPTSTTARRAPPNKWPHRSDLPDARPGIFSAREPNPPIPNARPLPRTQGLFASTDSAFNFRRFGASLRDFTSWVAHVHNYQ